MSSEQQITQPSARTISLAEIVELVLKGRVRIPRYQRKIRWQWSDVERLFDSIRKGYPIGSLLLWSRPAEAATLKLGALTIAAPKHDEAWWVVDGQQRLTSLANALSEEGCHDPRFGISYDLTSSAFTRGTVEREHSIPLPVIFDLQKLLLWFAEHPESNDYLSDAANMTKLIREYTIPAYIVKQQDEAVLRDIFDRINNYGKRLRRAEVFSALHTDHGRDGKPLRSLGDMVEEIDDQFGFGMLHENTVMQCILARRHPDPGRDVRGEFDIARNFGDFPNETKEDAYRLGEAALQKTVSFLQTHAAIPHGGFLGYRYLVVVLARFFAFYPEPSVRNQQLLKRWCWRALLIGPQTLGGGMTAMRAGTASVTANDESRSVQKLLAIFSEHLMPAPVVKKFHGTSASSRAILCALWSKKPRSVATGQPYELNELATELEGCSTATDVVFSIASERAAIARDASRVILLGDDTGEIARDCFSRKPVDMTEPLWPPLPT